MREKDGVLRKGNVGEIVGKDRESRGRKGWKEMG